MKSTFWILAKENLSYFYNDIKFIPQKSLNNLDSNSQESTSTDFKVDVSLSGFQSELFIIINTIISLYSANLILWY